MDDTSYLAMECLSRVIQRKITAKYQEALYYIYYYNDKFEWDIRQSMDFQKTIHSLPVSNVVF